jgi:hypothetical protein
VASLGKAIGLEVGVEVGVFVGAAVADGIELGAAVAVGVDVEVGLGVESRSSRGQSVSSTGRPTHFGWTTLTSPLLRFMVVLY